jgi:hypothetical protein
MFAFHTLAFPFWSALVDPRLVYSDNAFQKASPSWRLRFNRQTIARMLSCKLFWNPFCSNLLNQTWSLMNPWGEPRLMHRGCGHFIDSHVSIILNHATDWFDVFLCSGCGWASWSFFISDTCATVFEHLYTLRCGKAVSILCWKSAMDFQPLVHVQPTKFVSLHAEFWCKRNAERPC